MGSTRDERVCARAGRRCEYCRLPDSQPFVVFEIDHVVARQHGGSNGFDNLAYSCQHCNKSKGPNLSGIDRMSGTEKVVPLFHPRRQRWSRHFRLVGARIRGRTAAGRATVRTLQMNDPRKIALRASLIEEGLFPTG